MGKPAARFLDWHSCPMVTPAVVPIPHVGGPIVAPCSPNVIIGRTRAARVTDLCICVGPMDNVVMGSMTVRINGQPAARIGDSTAHGGAITTGLPTVLIGDNPLGSGGGEAANPVAIEFAEGILSIAYTWFEKEFAWWQTGNDHFNIKLGSAKAEAGSNIGYNVDKNSYALTPLDASFELAAAKLHVEGKGVGGLLAGEGDLTVASVKGKAHVGIEAGKEGVTTGAEAGAEAMAVRGSVKISLRLTPMTIYNNTIGLLTDSKLDERYDKGLVFSAEPEAGLGAAAKAEASLAVGKDKVEAKLGAKAGAGLVGGLAVKVGLEF